MLACKTIRSHDDEFEIPLAGGAKSRQGMVLTSIDQLWVADITFPHLAEELAFLAVVLDAFSRKVVDWALDTHLRANLAIEALEMALADRQPEHGSIVHHSDHGSQPSMSRVGNPYGNAKAESFMKTLKQEEVQGLGDLTCLALGFLLLERIDQFNGRE